MPAHNFRNALAAWNPRPANDNAPLTADSFATLAERRAFVQRPQRDANQVLNCPQLERFGRTSPEVVPLWRHWRDLQAAPAHDVYVGPEIVVDEGEEPANTGFSEAGEQDIEIRPSVEELLRAMDGAGRVSVCCTVNNGQRFDIHQERRPCSLGNTTKIGDLEFREGHLVRWGETSRGKPLEPVERLRGEKGSRQAPDADARRLVRTDAPVAKNAVFLAGVVRSTGKSGAPFECFAEREQSRKAKECELRQVLGAHAEILDLAIGDASAREIGERRGYIGKHAERRGVFLVSEAFAALRALVDENNLRKAA